LPYLLGGEKAIETASATKVNDSFPWLQSSYGLGIAAAKPHVGPFWNTKYLLLGIAHLFGKTFNWDNCFSVAC
jgi:hypothetical protein